MRAIYYICLYLFAFIFISIKEDLYQNTSISKRIFAIVLSSIIFFNLNKTNFPLIDIPLIYPLFQIIYFYLFFTFSSLVLINGFNLIDGMNGILGFTAISQLICLCYISQFLTNEIFNYSILLILPIIIFMF